MGLLEFMDRVSTPVEGGILREVDRFRFSSGTNEGRSAKIMFGISSLSIFTVFGVKKMIQKGQVNSKSVWKTIRLRDSRRQKWSTAVHRLIPVGLAGMRLWRKCNGRSLSCIGFVRW